MLRCRIVVGARQRCAYRECDNSIKSLHSIIPRQTERCPNTPFPSPIYSRRLISRAQDFLDRQSAACGMTSRRMAPPLCWRGSHRSHRETGGQRTAPSPAFTIARHMVQSDVGDAHARLILGLGRDSRCRKLRGKTECVISREGDNGFNFRTLLPCFTVAFTFQKRGHMR